jgi:hypothetical protein
MKNVMFVYCFLSILQRSSKIVEKIRISVPKTLNNIVTMVKFNDKLGRAEPGRGGAGRGWAGPGRSTSLSSDLVSPSTGSNNQLKKQDGGHIGI